MTNPRHFDHLSSESFEIIDSEHVPLFVCWYSPFFQIAKRLLKPNGLLVFTMEEMESHVKTMNPIDRESFFKTPTQNGFYFVDNSEDNQAISAKMTNLRNSAETWRGLCFRKFQNTTNNHQISSSSMGLQHFPSFELLMSKCTTFFEVVMYSKAVDYINTIRQDQYTQDQVKELEVKKNTFYQDIKNVLEQKTYVVIPSIDDATLRPEEFHVFLKKYLRTEEFKKFTGQNVNLFK